MNSDFNNDFEEDSIEDEGPITKDTSEIYIYSIITVIFVILFVCWMVYKVVEGFKEVMVPEDSEITATYGGKEYTSNALNELLKEIHDSYLSDMENDNVVNNITTNTIDKINELNVINDWKSGSFKLCGKEYKLLDDYIKFATDGWKINYETMINDDKYVRAESTYLGNVDLVKDSYKGTIVLTEVVNPSEVDKPIEECQISGIHVDNLLYDLDIPFELPGGIKNGSSYEEIVKVYGEPMNRFEVTAMKYDIYYYRTEILDDDFINLELVVDKEKGLAGFHYFTFLKP